jgi:Replication initiator protein A
MAKHEGFRPDQTTPALLEDADGNPRVPSTALPGNGDPAIRSADFIKIEKNLASLGFFTPSSKRIKAARKKTITFTKVIDGKKVEARANILPSAEYGLPITADQDKYLALQKIITDIRNRNGEVKNPIGFTSAELLRILGRRVTAGKNYDDIAEWLRRMTLTGISSEGTIYFAGRRIWAQDTFHVFERTVSFGAEMPDGEVAERNYVWLSEWQLENINNNYLVPIDLDTYRQLKNHIAKTIVPLLQIWLSATREEGYFEKAYDELCQILDISRYRHLSKIQEKLAPSLNELKACGYLADWRIVKLAEASTYKVVFFHGEKFRRTLAAGAEAIAM